MELLNNCEIILSCKINCFCPSDKFLLDGTLFGLISCLSWDLIIQIPTKQILLVRRELNLSPLSYRPQIAIVGTRNVGKSRFVNTLIGKDVTKVSKIAGTTINPIKNPLELLPYGPVLIVDTAGIEDEGELGSGRITQTIRTISSADFVLLLVDARN